MMNWLSVKNTCSPCLPIIAILIQLLIPIKLVAGDRPSLEPSDIAILMDKSSEAKITFSASVFSDSWFEQVSEGFLNSSVGDAFYRESPRETWRLVAVRVVPCNPLDSFPSPKQVERCWPELRLVWQPIIKNVSLGGVVFKDYADDRAVHTLYDILPGDPHSRTEVLAYLNDLRSGRPLGGGKPRFRELRKELLDALFLDVLALRDSSYLNEAYAALNVRPEFEHDKVAFAFVKRLTALIEKYARPRDIKELTAFSLPEGRQPMEINEWVFLAFSGMDGNIVPQDIHLRSTKDGASLLNLGPANRSSMARDDALFYEQDEDFEAMLRDHLILYINDLNRLRSKIADRTKILVPNTSCTSCHKLGTSRENFHNLSYFEDEPISISPRVVKDVELDLQWISANPIKTSE